MIYILLAGIFLNIISGIYLVKVSVNEGRNVLFGEIIIMGFLSLIPFLITVVTIFGYIDFDKVIFEGKTK